MTAGRRAGINTGAGAATSAEPSIHQLRLYLTLNEELHFGRAAARLFITQPALSQQIRELERRLGVRVMERTSRTNTLTDAGHALLPEARAAVAAVGRLRRVADAQLRQVSGRLVDGIPTAHGGRRRSDVLSPESRTGLLPTPGCQIHRRGRPRPPPHPPSPGSGKGSPNPPSERFGKPPRKPAARASATHPALREGPDTEYESAPTFENTARAQGSECGTGRGVSAPAGPVHRCQTETTASARIQPRPSAAASVATST